MKVRYDSYCGLYCGACPVGMANELNDTEGIEKMAQEWGTSQKDLKCTGCKTELTAKFCKKCEMRICAMERNLEFCSQCGDFPCIRITEFCNDDAPHHSAVFTNLENIKKNGLEAWLKTEKKRWSCPSCGTRFSWYIETCSKCGTKLRNAVSEEKDSERACGN